MYALEITWKLQRRLDTKTRIHCVIRLVSSAERCANEITEELHRNFAEIAPRALNIPSDLAENAESESVRLGATRDFLDRAEFRPVDRHEIVKEKSVEELNAQLVSLVGDDGAEMLISSFRSRSNFSSEAILNPH